MNYGFVYICCLGRYPVVLLLKGFFRMHKRSCLRVCVNGLFIWIDMTLPTNLSSNKLPMLGTGIYSWSIICLPLDHKKWFLDYTKMTWSVRVSIYIYHLIGVRSLVFYSCVSCVSYHLKRPLRFASLLVPSVLVLVTAAPISRSVILAVLARVLTTAHLGGCAPLDPLGPSAMAWILGRCFCCCCYSYCICRLYTCCSKTCPNMIKSYNGIMKLHDNIIVLYEIVIVVVPWYIIGV